MRYLLALAIVVVIGVIVWMIKVNTKPKKKKLMGRESKLTTEWSEYNHDYEKRVQDIRLKNGNEVMECWPNAGKWYCLSGDKRYSKKDIPDAEVTHTRLNNTDLDD